jgi:hypothetical protein
MRFRLTFWMKDPAGVPGDVVEVPDSQVPALVQAGIGHPEDSAAPPADGPADTPGQEPATPAAASSKAAKATKTD